MSGNWYPSILPQISFKGKQRKATPWPSLFGQSQKHPRNKPKQGRQEGKFAKEGNFAKDGDFAQDGNFSQEGNVAEEGDFAQEGNVAKTATLPQRVTSSGGGIFAEDGNVIEEGKLAKEGNFAKKGDLATRVWHGPVGRADTMLGTTAARDGCGGPQRPHPQQRGLTSTLQGQYCPSDDASVAGMTTPVPQQ